MYFTNFISFNNLKNFEKEGPRYPFTNKQVVPLLSKLDRFVARADWVDSFLALKEKSLDFYLSDLRVLLLNPSHMLDGGPKPFRFQPHYFDERSLMDKLENWWLKFDFWGNLGVILHKKLKALREI